MRHLNDRRWETKIVADSRRCGDRVAIVRIHRSGDRVAIERIHRIGRPR